MELVKILFILLGSFLGVVLSEDKTIDKVADYLEEVFNNSTNTANIEFGKQNNVNNKRTLKDIGEEIIKKLTTLFNERLSTMMEIATHAETLYKNYTMKNDLDDTYEYFDANDESEKEKVQIHKTFSNEIKVNLNLSSVQTPADVYQFAPKILNSIEWTKGLNMKFQENQQKKTKFKSWQYIGLSDGVYRSYPGSYWLKASEKLAYFDCRQRAWYIDGSAPPKDMVILLDMSGSVIGNRLLIVKLAAMSLIDTLHENDFVNIIYFNEKAYYLTTLAENYNWTHLVQATARNKKILKDALQKDLTGGKARAKVEVGFKMAFELLQKSRKNVRSTSNCTQTIAFFTDGVEGDTVAEDVFNGYNSEKRVRVFTYLVGREKGTPFRAVRWIACKNKGYFYRIETLSDVRENIVKYVNVLSRSTVRKPNWTPLYLDAQGLGLLSSLVVPIFNTKDDSAGEQLGVIGSDIKLDEIYSNIPEYELGAGGYAFSITNNGLIFFHPLLEKEHSVSLTHSTDVYLSEVERHFPDNKNIHKLARAMIDKGKSSFPGNSKFMLTKYNGKFRIVNRTIEYYYGHIKNTSFSVAVALTEYGKRKIKPKDESGEAPMSSENYNVTAAQWPYCNETIENVEELKQLLKMGDNLDFCTNKKLIKHVQSDLRTMKDWKPILKEVVTKVFVGTASGLTFFTPKADNPVLETSIKKEYYERAADHWKKPIIVFSSLNKNEVLASRALVTKNEEAVWGVTGAHIKHQKLQEILDHRSECSNKDKVCYLVDENGYIVVSGKASGNRSGEFFGKVEGTVMKDLIHQGAFLKFDFTDVQATCEAESDEESSSSVRILDPLYAFANYAKWWTRTIALSFIQYSFYAIMSGTNQVKADDDAPASEYCYKQMDLYIRVDSQKSFSNESLSYDGCKKSYVSHLIDRTNLMLVEVTHENSTYCARRNEKMNDDPRRIPMEPSGGSPEYYRKEPEGIHGCYPKPKESEECSSGKFLLPSVFLIILLQAAILMNDGQFNQE